MFLMTLITEIDDQSKRYFYLHASARLRMSFQPSAAWPGFYAK